MKECRIHGSISYVKSPRPWSCKAPPNHHTTTTMFDCWYDVLFMKSCVGFMPDVMGHTPSKKWNVCLISLQNICPKVLEIINIFVANVRQILVFLELSHGCRFCPVFFSSYCWIMNTDLYWGKWDLQFFKCCSVLFYYHLDESSLHSWSNFGRPATPGKVYKCSKCSPFVDNGSDRGLLESQSLKNGFIILSRLIHMGPVS